MLTNRGFLSGKIGSVSYYMTRLTSIQMPLDGPGWASASPDGLGTGVQIWVKTQNKKQAPQDFGNKREICHEFSLRSVYDLRFRLFAWPRGQICLILSSSSMVHGIWLKFWLSVLAVFWNRLPASMPDSQSPQQRVRHECNLQFDEVLLEIECFDIKLWPESFPVQWAPDLGLDKFSTSLLWSLSRLRIQAEVISNYLFFCAFIFCVFSFPFEKRRILFLVLPNFSAVRRGSRRRISSALSCFLQNFHNQCSCFDAMVNAGHVPRLSTSSLKRYWIVDPAGCHSSNAMLASFPFRKFHLE